MSNSGFAQLRALQAQLNRLIDAAEGVSFAGLDEPRDVDEPLAPQDARLAPVSSTLAQMSALVGGPRTILTHALSFHVPSCMRVAIEAHVEETLREAGKPLSATEIAKSSCIDPDKLARVLRLMAANFMFTEVEPAVFARNHLSSMLDTGKSVRILQSDPENAFVDTNGIAALVAHTSEEILKASSFVPDTLLSPELAKSASPQDAPFARAFNGVTAFEYLGAHPRLMKRFAAAMAPFSKLVNPDIGSEKLTGFPWGDLAEGSKIVDVGGGVGHLSLAIGAKVPHVNFVIQDRPEVVATGPAIWDKAASPELRSRVTFEAHDFFKPQPVKDASVFVLRTVIHDWPEAESVKILSHLRHVATPGQTKLVLVELTLNELSPPNPCPPPYIFSYYIDMQMLCALNAQERTESGYEALGKKSGWRLVKTYKTGLDGDEGPYRHFEFMPA